MALVLHFNVKKVAYCSKEVKYVAALFAVVHVKGEINLCDSQRSYVEINT